MPSHCFNSYNASFPQLSCTHIYNSGAQRSILLPYTLFLILNLETLEGHIFVSRSFETGLGLFNFMDQSTTKVRSEMAKMVN